MPRRIYVLPDRKGWSVKRGCDAPAMLSTHASKADAVLLATEIAADEGVSMVVLDEQGRDITD